MDDLNILHREKPRLLNPIAIISFSTRLENSIKTSEDGFCKLSGVMSDQRTFIEQVGMDNPCAFDLDRVERPVNADLLGTIPRVQLSLSLTDGPVVYDHAVEVEQGRVVANDFE